MTLVALATPKSSAWLKSSEFAQKVVLFARSRDHPVLFCYIYSRLSQQGMAAQAFIQCT